VTIRKGEEWGAAVERPADLVVVESDAALAAAVAAATAPVWGVSGGDLHRSLGSPRLDGRSIVQRLDVDALRVELDGRRVLAVAHVVVRRSWWRGPLLAVLNCDHLGSWNVAPRAHPNDGRFDVVEVAAAMPPRARLAARRRLPAGTHVPHPDIAVSTSTHREWTFDRPLRAWVDGIESGRCRRLSVTIEPDRFAICV
jgi:hypothetical protein